jgi:hypothetical protein
MIAGRGLHEQQRRGGDDEDQQHGEQEPTDEEAQQPAVHDGVFGRSAARRYRGGRAARLSAVHSRCGICSAGVAPCTFGVVASVTFGATK